MTRHPSRKRCSLASPKSTDPDPADVSTSVAAGRPVGTGGMVTKVAAARIATGAGIPVVLAHADAIAAALAGDDVGTWFSPTGRRTPTRLLWLAHAATPHGRAGARSRAVTAVVERRASLLPAGITRSTDLSLPEIRST